MTTTGRAHPRRAWWLAASVAAAMPAAGWAQQAVPPQQQGVPTVADPATLLEQQRRRQEQLAQPPRPDAAAPVTDQQPPDAAAPTAGETRFVLKAVRFPDSAYLTAAELQAAAAPFLGRTVSFADLGRLADAVNALYVRRGVYTGRALLPPQTIRDGTVEIRLVEGRIDEVRVEGARAARQHYVARRVRLPRNELADVRAIEREVLRFNNTEDAQLRASMQSGKGFGLTDIVLAVTEPPRARLDLIADTNGYASTGRFQGGGVARLYDLAGTGDRLAATVLASRGLTSGSLSYNAPIDWRGSRLGFSVSHGGSTVVAGPYAALDVSGRSTTAAINTATPLLVTGRWVVSLATSGQFTRSVSDVTDVRVSDARIWSTETGLNLSYTGPRTVVSLQASVGAADTTERLLDLRRSVFVARGSLYALHAPTTGLRLRLRGDWQYIPDDGVIGTLQYQIGGAQSARAFRAGTAAGDRGYFASLEAGHPITVGRSGGEVYAFVDRAQVFPNFPDVRLMSAGVGANVALNGRLLLEGTVATPIADNLPGRPERVRALASLNFRLF